MKRVCLWFLRVTNDSKMSHKTFYSQSDSKNAIFHRQATFINFQKLINLRKTVIFIKLCTASQQNNQRKNLVVFFVQHEKKIRNKKAEERAWHVLISLLYAHCNLGRGGVNGWVVQIFLW